MSTRFPRSSRHPSRRELRRRLIARTAAWVASGALVSAAFAGGYLWRQDRANRAAVAVQAPPPESSDEQQAEALQLFDEAVRARFEERAQGAMNAVTAARRADPQLRGVDVLVGEIALEERDPEAVRRAAGYALSRGENESSANLLNALEVWMRRGEKGMDKAGQLAEQFLSDAADEEPSDAAAYFFHGELSRLLGDGRNAHRFLLSALYRQQPWQSATLLENKMQIAAREAAEEGRAVVVAPATKQTEAVLALRSAVQSGSSANEQLAECVRATPSLQLAALASDSAFGSSRNLRQLESLSQRMEAMIPHSRKSPSAVAE